MKIKDILHHNLWEVGPEAPLFNFIDRRNAWRAAIGEFQPWRGRRRGSKEGRRIELQRGGEGGNVYHTGCANDSVKPGDGK